MAVPASASSAARGAFFTSNVPSACIERGPSLGVVWECGGWAETRVGMMNHPESSRRGMLPILVRRTISPSVNKKLYGSRLGDLDRQPRLRLLGKLEDADLHELGDGEVFEAAVLHAANEIGRDFKDANLDEFVEGRLIAQGANLLHFVGVDSLDLEADEFVGIRLLVTHGN